MFTTVFHHLVCCCVPHSCLLLCSTSLSDAVFCDLLCCCIPSSCSLFFFCHLFPAGCRLSTILFATVFLHLFCWCSCIMLTAVFQHLVCSCVPPSCLLLCSSILFAALFNYSVWAGLHGPVCCWVPPSCLLLFSKIMFPAVFYHFVSCCVSQSCLLLFSPILLAAEYHRLLFVVVFHHLDFCIDPSLFFSGVFGWHHVYRSYCHHFPVYSVAAPY
jgi:hypothetical protein